MGKLRHQQPTGGHGPPGSNEICLSSFLLKGTLFLWVKYSEYGWNSKLDGIFLHCVDNNEQFSVVHRALYMGIHMTKDMLLRRGKGSRVFVFVFVFFRK